VKRQKPFLESSKNTLKRFLLYWNRLRYNKEKSFKVNIKENKP
jgi:hypothetical protein